MQRNLVNLFGVLAILIVITACVCPSGRDKGDPQTSPTPTTSKSTDPGKKNTGDKTSTNKDEGDFKVEHEAITNSKYAEIDAQVKKERLLENAADQLNRSLALPDDIILRAKSCGDVNAYYDSNDISITVCYELMEYYYGVFRASGLADQKAYDKMFAAVRFVFLHEVGHALIDQYKLPVTGNEEDAADRCAAFINIEELGRDGVDACLAAADAFRLDSKRAPTDKHDLADEHLLGEQRSYNSLCMIYGSDSSKYSNILTEGYLPKARAERCETEYQRMSESWSTLLKPWRKS